MKETGRDRYVSDGEFQAVWEKADQTTRDAMDLALLTSQRPADVPKSGRTDPRDSTPWIVQNKTKRVIEITGELAQLIERIADRIHQITCCAQLPLDFARFCFESTPFRRLESTHRASQLQDAISAWKRSSVRNPPLFG